MQEILHYNFSFTIEEYTAAAELDPGQLIKAGCDQSEDASSARSPPADQKCNRYKVGLFSLYKWNKKCFNIHWKMECEINTF